ncbi:unnamed protein product [Symbiodinium microadriaticum]|nr:unnamed protein product [Symbiodinium microadriaticum]CAE7944198.1 unnamed protein product [Symbiodinium sp. KB8]
MRLVRQMQARASRAQAIVPENLSQDGTQLPDEDGRDASNHERIVGLWDSVRQRDQRFLGFISRSQYAVVHGELWVNGRARQQHKTPHRIPLLGVPDVVMAPGPPKALKSLHAVARPGSAIDLVWKDPARKDYALKAVAVHGRALQFLSTELRADKEVVLKALKSDGWALQWASEELRRDKDVIFKALKKEVRSLQFVAEDLLSDRDFCLEAISKNGLAYEFADPEVKADREVARAAVCQDGLALEFVPEQFQSDPELVLKAVQNCGLALRFASPELRGNKGLVLTAAKQDSSAFKFASQELQQNRDVWLQVCPSRLGHWQNHNEVLQEVEKEGLLLQLANQRLVSQPEVMFKAAVKDHHTLQHASPEICADVDFVLRLIKEDVRALTYAADEIRADREVALKATAIDGSSLQFFTQELCEDREVVLTAVRHTGTALAFAAPELRADREVVLAAMAQSRTALLFAAEELRRDKAMWLYNGEEPPVFDPPPEEEQEAGASYEAQEAQAQAGAESAERRAEEICPKHGIAMAYGLRKITGTTYWPYGTGRDWFFVGDLDYMHGRRTPKVEVRERFEKLTPPLRKKRGHPQDMVFSQASIRSMTSTVGVPSVPGVFGGKSQQPRLSIRTLERWRSLNEATFGEMTGGGELERWRCQSAWARELLVFDI